MFEIATNVHGDACIVTDNPIIADAIREEGVGVPVFFTGAPNLKVARGLAKGLAKDFDRKAVVWRSGGACPFYVDFAE